jgi:hypothetical protein
MLKIGVSRVALLFIIAAALPAAPQQPIITDVALPAATPRCVPPLEQTRNGLPLKLAQKLNYFTAFAAVLADFAYVKDFVTGSNRRSITPCLQAWGAKGTPTVIDSTDSAGGISHCTVFRTNFDIFVLFR